MRTVGTSAPALAVLIVASVLAHPARAQTSMQIEATAEITRDASFTPGEATRILSFPVYRTSSLTLELRYASWASARITGPSGALSCASLVTKGAQPAAGDFEACRSAEYRTVDNDGTCTTDVPSTGVSHDCGAMERLVPSLPGIHVAVTIPNPESGTWQIAVTNDVVEPEPAVIHVKFDSPIRLGALVLPDTVRPGATQLPIFATLADDEAPGGAVALESYTARARILGVEPPRDLDRTATLVDVHPALSPEEGDGVFAALLDVTGLPRGEYLAALSFAGSLRGGAGTFLREANVMFRIADEPTVVIPGDEAPAD